MCFTSCVVSRNYLLKLYPAQLSLNKMYIHTTHYKPSSKWFLSLFHQITNPKYNIFFILFQSSSDFHTQMAPWNGGIFIFIFIRVWVFIHSMFYKFIVGFFLVRWLIFHSVFLCFVACASYDMHNIMYSKCSFVCLMQIMFCDLNHHATTFFTFHCKILNFLLR